MMEQVEVCNSWEEFDDNSKLLEQQLEKLKLQKARKAASESRPEPDLPSPESSLGNNTTEGAPKMRILKRNAGNSPEEAKREVATSSTNGINHDSIIIQDDSMRTQYVPPEPRISILSRPKKKSPEEEASNSKNSQSKGQSKTLEQREQEYAEARRRIFGDQAEGEGETESSEVST